MQQAAYPPTHQYEIRDGLFIPGDILRERMALIQMHFPVFFSGTRFLDVGCSYGYMSLVASSYCRQVIGIDSNPAAVQYAKVAAKSVGSKAEIQCISFRNFHDSESFDRIFIGNGPHHLYREIGGHEWVAKLAALSDGLVLTEGPLDRSCPDLAKQPEIYLENFDAFTAAMLVHFVKLRQVPSVSYSPGRYMTLWIKRPESLVKDDLVIYKKFRHDQYVDNNRVTIGVAASSPISNGMLWFTDDGWAELRDESELYKEGENAEALFRMHCVHQVWLSKLGYVDLDSGTINHFKNNDALFDKSGVIPITTLTLKHVYAYEQILNRNHGRHLTSRETLRILDALSSMSADRIQRTFEWLLYRD